MDPAAESKWRPLGALLVEQGVVTARELEEGLAEQARTGEKLGEILVNRGFASRLAIVDALAEQSGQLLAPEGGFGTGLRALMKRRPRNAAPAAEADVVAEAVPPDESAEPPVEATVIELRPELVVAEPAPDPDEEPVAEPEPVEQAPPVAEPDLVPQAPPVAETDGLRAELEAAYAALAAAEERLERERAARVDLEADSAERAALRTRLAELEHAKAYLEAAAAERAEQLRAANETIVQLQSAGLEAELRLQSLERRLADTHAALERFLALELHALAPPATDAAFPPAGHTSVTVSDTGGAAGRLAAGA